MATCLGSRHTFWRSARGSCAMVTELLGYLDVVSVVSSVVAVVEIAATDVSWGHLCLDGTVEGNRN